MKSESAVAAGGEDRGAGGSSANRCGECGGGVSNRTRRAGDRNGVCTKSSLSSSELILVDASAGSDGGVTPVDGALGGLEEGGGGEKCGVSCASTIGLST